MNDKDNFFLLVPRIHLRSLSIEFCLYSVFKSSSSILRARFIEVESEKVMNWNSGLNIDEQWNKLLRSLKICVPLV